MSAAVWKYPFKTRDGFALDMPRGAEVLAVQTQNDVPCLWALVDPTAEKEPRWFRIYGTGHAIDGDGRKYLGTYQLSSGALVFHVFEVLPMTPAS